MFDFGTPSENYSKLPHSFMEVLAAVDNLAELKVILYILRHTWGYQEYEKPKKITKDEFMHGRKKRNGERIDQGTGLSKNSVLSGIRLAIEHGYIVESTDDSDLARVEKSYSLVNLRNVGVQKLNSQTDLGVQSLNPRGSEVEPRSEKETIERNPRKKKTITATPLAEVSEQIQNAELSSEFKENVVAGKTDRQSEKIQSATPYPYADALKAVSDAFGVNGTYERRILHMLAGGANTGEWKACSLTWGEGGLVWRKPTPDDILGFRRWWMGKGKGLDMPKKPMTIQSEFIAYMRERRAQVELSEDEARRREIIREQNEAAMQEGMARLTFDFNGAADLFSKLGEK